MAYVSFAYMKKLLIASAALLMVTSAAQATDNPKYEALGNNVRCFGRYSELHLPRAEYEEFMNQCLYPHTLEECNNYTSKTDPCADYEPTMKDAPSWLRGSQ
jgi:hypothetical protein